MLWTGFVLGIMGSLHCIGMCGPIALALPVPEGASRTIAILLYNLGRTITYSVLGFTFGALGYLVLLSGFPQYLSIVCGAIVLLIGVSSFAGRSYEIYLGKFFTRFSILKNQLSVLFKKRSLSSLLFIGILNGLLPCGMVYAALIGSVATGSFVEGSIYMFLFGLGTVPLMFLLFYVKTINVGGRAIIRKMIPLISVLTGLLLILRGMNLNIPYVSPEVSDKSVTCCSIHHH